MTVARPGEPAPPAGASIVAPANPAEAAATAGFLTFVDQLLDWGRANAAQAEAGRAWCAAQVKP